MDFLKSRFPSAKDMGYVFVACAFPIHVWSIIGVLREIPAWILRMSLWDMLGVIAYTQVFALVESGILFLALLLLSALLPRALFRSRFIALATVAVFSAAAWLVFLHLNSQIIETGELLALMIWGVSYLLVLGALVVLVHRRSKVEAWIGRVVQRLSVLSLTYVLIDVLSVFVVIVRNW